MAEVGRLQAIALHNPVVRFPESRNKKILPGLPGGAKLLEALGATCCVRPLSHWTNQLGQLIWTKIFRLGHFSTHQAPIHTITPSGSFLLTPPRLTIIFLLLIFLQRTRSVREMFDWLVVLLGLIEPNRP